MNGALKSGNMTNHSTWECQYLKQYKWSDVSNAYTIKECLNNRHVATIAKDVSSTSHEDGQYGIVMTWAFPRKI